MLCLELCPYSYFWWCGYSWGPWVSFVMTDEFSLRITKITSRFVSHELTAYLSLFDLFLTQWIMAILSKGCKPDNFESHKSLKLSFTNLRSSFKFCCVWTPHTFMLCVRQTWMTQFWQFLYEELSSFDTKGLGYSCAWCCSLCEGGTFFGMGLISRKFRGFSLMFSTSFTSLNVLLCFPLSITFCVSIYGFWCYFI